MSGRTPEDLEALLEDAILLEDAVAVAGLFEPRGLLDPGDGEPARGTAEIVRSARRLWADGRDRYLADPGRVVRAHDLALVVGAVCVTVARRGPDGFWRYPFAVFDRTDDGSGHHTGQDTRQDRRRGGAMGTTTDDRCTVVSEDGTEIVLHRVGSGPSRLLCVPGGPTTGARWAAVAALLDGRRECWLMDRRGRGASGNGAEPYAFEREFADVGAAVDALGPGTDVAGHSSGAVCVLGAALAGAPVGSLLLYEPPWHLPDHPVPSGAVEAFARGVADGNRDDALAFALREMVGMPPRAVEALRGTPLWGEYRTHLHTWPREMRALPDLPPVERLEAVTVPVLMLLGEHTGAYLRLVTERLSAALPAATVRALPGEGHGALGTAPHLVAAAIADLPPGGSGQRAVQPDQRTGVTTSTGPSGGAMA